MTHYIARISNRPQSERGEKPLKRSPLPAWEHDLWFVVAYLVTIGIAVLIAYR